MKLSHSTAAVAAGILLLLPVSSAAADSSPPLVHCDFAGYQQHLQQLAAIVQACSAQPSSSCGPAQVGPDDEVATATGTRLVHYGWLRHTLQNAGKTSTTAGKPADEAHAQLLSAAARLAQDIQPASQRAAASPESTALARANLSSILAERRFQRIHQDPSLLQRAQVAILNWLYQRLSKVAAYGGRNPWIAHLLEFAAILVPCVLLAWWVMVRLRQQASASQAAQPVSPAAPSAREWQRWLQDAERFARQSQWREAVHHVYWAAISRLESQGLWPADRARTPREYLALLRSGNGLEPELRGLTRSFELIWYGNRPAAEEQYRDARARMDNLSRLVTR